MLSIKLHARDLVTALTFSVLKGGGGGGGGGGSSIGESEGGKEREIR